MQTIKSFIQNFITRAGNYVLLSTILARLLSFLASWIALQLIDNKELGIVIFAFNIISFFIPLGGFGLHQSLIRYGALTKTEKEKNNLFIYTLKKGIMASLLLILLIIVFNFFVNFSFYKSNRYVMILSFIILPSYVFELIKIQFRLQHNNKSFAYSELVYTVILVISVFLLSFLYQEKGYIVALLTTPILASIIFIKKLNIDFKGFYKPHLINLSFYKYGFFASLSNVVTQLLFAIDIFLIGYLLIDAEMITNYKYVSLIPFSLLFLPRVFITTDFVSFTEKISDNAFIKNYISGYMRFFIIVSITLLLFSFLFSKQILALFGNDFKNFSITFLILVFGVCGILIFRGLFGNLLSSIGRAKINYYIALSALILNIISNYFLIPNYGIKGAAITSAVIMWFTGLLSYFLFFRYYKKLK